MCFQFCEIDHRVEMVTAKQLFHRRPVGQVRAGEAEPCMILDQREACLFQADIVVIVEVVQPHHLVAALQQFTGDVKSDKSGGAGH